MLAILAVCGGGLAYGNVMPPDLGSMVCTLDVPNSLVDNCILSL